MSEPKKTIRPEESLAKMIESLKEKTGKTLEEWRVVIADAGWQKHGEIVSGIKTQHGVSHGYANQIALRSKEPGELHESDPIKDMFAKRPEAKTIYDEILVQLNTFGSDVDLAPKKGYVSVRRKKQFAILQPASARLDVGIQLKGVVPNDRLEASGSFNAMLSHRVRITTLNQVDEQLIGWLNQAYEAAG